MSVHPLDSLQDITCSLGSFYVLSTVPETNKQKIYIGYMQLKSINYQIVLSLPQAVCVQVQIRFPLSIKLSVSFRILERLIDSGPSATEFYCYWW